MHVAAATRSRLLPILLVLLSCTSERQRALERAVEAGDVAGVRQQLPGE